MVIQSDKCSTVQQYIEKLSLANSDWWKNDENFWIFRGQSHNELIPSLYRKNRNSEKIKYQELFDSIHTKLIKGVPDLLSAIQNTVNNNQELNTQQSERLIELAKASFAEIHLTEEFLLRCNKIRLSTPSLKLFENQSQSVNAVAYLYDHLDKLLKEFIKMSYCNVYSPFFNIEYPESMALSRHHSVPSSLLDWSEDPLIAIFFSVSGNKNGNPCVWALNKEYLRRDLGRIEFYDKLSRTGLEFLHVQKGLFTHMIGAAEYYYRTGKWPTLDQYLLNTYVDVRSISYPQNDYIKKIELDKSQKDALILRLHKMGINQHTLMPTYDNVGQSVQKL